MTLTKTPKKMPDSGELQAAFIGVTHQRLEIFFEIMPAHHLKADILAYLHYAIEQAESYKRIVHSIFWQTASAQVRADIAAKLTRIKADIIDALLKFGNLWNQYIEVLDNNEDIDLILEKHYKCLYPETYDIFVRTTKQNIVQAISNLHQLISQIKG